MKKILFITAILFAFRGSYAQSIRKNYLEMTPSEKSAFVAALYKLRHGADLINDLAAFHGNNFNSIHFNLPSSPGSDVFLAWHRRQIFELEQATQNINPNLSIPFWDWTTDNSVNSPLWGNDFLGTFNSDWRLNRSLGGGSLPTTAQVAQVQSITNWLDYSNSLERGPVHVNPHGWVGGTMSGGFSPGDPIFYMHHGMLDKLWQDWVEANNITSSSNLYIRTTLPRYDGTYVFNGQKLPAVNPNDIVDARALGVFFAENKLVELNKYTVSNTYKSQENFYYQYTIEAGNNFVVPSGKNAKIESVTKIVLKPGFSAKAGSIFTAKIDTDNNINSNTRSTLIADNVRNSTPFDNIDYQDAYSKRALQPVIEFEAYPNPVHNYLNIKLLGGPENCEIELYDLRGRIMSNKKLNGTNNTRIELNNIPKGVYLLKLTQNDIVIGQQKIVKH